MSSPSTRNLTYRTPGIVTYARNDFSAQGFPPRSTVRMLTFAAGVGAGAVLFVLTAAGAGGGAAGGGGGAGGASGGSRSVTGARLPTVMVTVFDFSEVTPLASSVASAVNTCCPSATSSVVLQLPSAST